MNDNLARMEKVKVGSIPSTFLLKGGQRNEEDLEENLSFCELVFDITSLNRLGNGYSVYSLKPLHEIYNLITKSVFVTLLGDFKVGKTFILV
jgi:hypothetical protein